MDFPTPKNLNYWWTFGAILALMLVIQIVTGIVLAMHYTPQAGLAFNSVELIKRDVNGGRIIQARPLDRRLDVLLRRLHPYFPRPLLRLIQGAARNPLDARRADPAADDGHGLLRLRAAVGPDELLGRHRDHQHLRGHPGRSAIRCCSCCAAALRSTIRRSTASSRCTTCCRSSSRRWSCCTSGRCTCRATTTRSAST